MPSELCGQTKDDRFSGQLGFGVYMYEMSGVFICSYYKQVLRKRPTAVYRVQVLQSAAAAMRIVLRYNTIKKLYLEQSTSYLVDAAPITPLQASRHLDTKEPD